MNILQELFTVFFKIGLFSFGGGYTILSVIQNEIVSRNWLSLAEYAQIVTISQMTPGPIVINAATFVGSKMCPQSLLSAFLGAFVATVGVGLPSFFIVLAVAKSLKEFQSSTAVKYIMAGIRPAIIGFMFVASLAFGKLAFFYDLDLGLQLTNLNPWGFLIFLIACYLNYYRNLSPIKLILFCGVLGLALL